jgi:invasion protein IalB
VAAEPSQIRTPARNAMTVGNALTGLSRAFHATAKRDRQLPFSREVLNCLADDEILRTLQILAAVIQELGNGMKKVFGALTLAVAISSAAYAETKPAAGNKPAATPPSAASQQKAADPANAGSNRGPQKEWKEAFDDWIVACVQASTGKKSCVMSQTLSNAQTRQIVGVLSVGKDEAGKLFANVQTPLGFLVHAGLKLAIDAQPAVQVPIRTCLNNGCLGVLELDAKAAGDFQKATKLVVSMQSLDGQPINVTYSANGLQKAYAKLLDESK